MREARTCRVAKMAKEKKAKELKDKREQQAKELREKRDAEKQAIQVRAAAAAAAANAAVGVVAVVRGGTGADPAAASRPPGKQPTRVESSELARMRLVQRTLVYVIGLSPRLAKEELLRRHEFLSLSEGIRCGTHGASAHCPLWHRALGRRRGTVGAPFTGVDPDVVRA